MIDCPVLSCPVESCRVLFCSALSYLLHPTLSYLTITFHTSLSLFLTLHYTSAHTGTLSVLDKWLTQIENNRNSPENAIYSSGNQELVDYLYQDIGGSKVPRVINSVSSKDLKDFASLPADSNQSAQTSSKQNETVEKVISNHNTDILRCFAIVYERKGTKVYISSLRLSTIMCTFTLAVVSFTSHLIPLHISTDLNYLLKFHCTYCTTVRAAGCKGAHGSQTLYREMDGLHLMQRVTTLQSYMNLNRCVLTYVHLLVHI
jgi:hypothetical protein